MLKRFIAPTVGTRSLLYGAHCFFIHPFFLILSWYKLWGFKKVNDPHVGPVSLKDPRLWTAFIIHDWGYWGSPNMDGPEGEAHPEWAAKIMSRLFDRKEAVHFTSFGRVYVNGYALIDGRRIPHIERFGSWGRFCLFHSRFYASRHNSTYSALCVADKLATTLEPWWFYLPRVILSGEIKEYMEDGQKGAQGEGKYAGEDHTAKEYENRRDWYGRMAAYMREWAYEHRHFKEDQNTLREEKREEKYARKTA